ncbi:MAG: enoyl-CoA hydratase-related protein, partial [Candidatus Methylomirabilota bacterium]
MEPTDEHSLVRFRVEEGLATLTLFRPPLNPLSHQLKSELAACLERLAADASIRCLILHGAGRAFSVGADIKEFPEVVAKNLGRS